MKPGNLFGAAVEFTLGQEGGWADNPADPGGPTMRGITLAVFRAWHHDRTAQPNELRAIQLDEVEAIYRALYWNPIAGASLPSGVGLSVFDAAVNLGVRRGTKLLQAALGVAQDGAIGPATLDAANRAASGMLLDRLASQREALYRCCANFPVFGRSWLNRNRACLLAARRAAGISVDEVPASPASIVSVPAHSAADALNAEELVQIGSLKS